MANELTVSASLRYSKNGVNIDSDDFGAAGVQIDVTGTEILRHVQLVGTSEEALYVGADIGTPGYVLMKNLDPTNYVSVRAASGVADLIKLSPGEIALFRLQSTAPYVIANTAACRLAYIVIET